MPKITDEEAKRFGDAYNRLFEQTHKQLVEYKMWLQTNIQARVQDAGLCNQLLAEVEQIKLVSVSPEQRIRQADDAGGRQPTISMIVEYPDVLHAWLEANGNERFNLSLQGGVTLDDKPIFQRDN